MNIRTPQELFGLAVAVVGFLMVAFAKNYTILSLAGSDSGIWVDGFLGLSLLIIGTLIVVKR